jgi:hypothetical protein
MGWAERDPSKYYPIGGPPSVPGSGAPAGPHRQRSPAPHLSAHPWLSVGFPCLSAPLRWPRNGLLKPKVTHPVRFWARGSESGEPLDSHGKNYPNAARPSSSRSSHSAEQPRLTAVDSGLTSVEPGATVDASSEHGVCLEARRSDIATAEAPTSEGAGSARSASVRRARPGLLCPRRTANTDQVSSATPHRSDRRRIDA